MIKFINDNGIVINKRDFGEADRYITVFTEHYGKVEFFLKGIRKSKKRELSSVDVLNFSKFTFYKKGENYTLSNSLSLDSYLEIKSDLENLSIALYFISLLNTVLVENNRKKSLFDLTLKTLNFLKGNSDERKNYILIAYYLYHLIKDEGLKIESGTGYNFSFEKSKFLEENERFTYRVSQEVKDTIEMVIAGKVKEIINGKYLIEDIKEAISIFEKYINFHFGTSLKLKNYVMGVEND